MTNSKHTIVPKKGQAFNSADDDEMAGLIRKKDWSKTSLGSPENWPASLRLMVRAILDNPLAMCIAWGKDFIQIYNDPFSRILGSEIHPNALGREASKTFEANWRYMEPLFQRAMKGEKVIEMDFRVPPGINENPGERYFNFAFSPLRDEEGTPAGVLITVAEVTDRKRVEDELKDARERMQYATNAADIATWVYDPQQQTFVCDQLLKDWFDLPDSENFPLEMAMEKLVSADRVPIQKAIENALDADGGIINKECTIIHPRTGKPKVLRVKGRAVFKENVATRLYGILQDITSETFAQRKMKESAANFLTMVSQAPFSIAILRGPEYIVEVVNDHALALWRRKREDVIQKPILESMPELTDQGIKELLDGVYKSGETFSATEMPVQILKNGNTEETFLNFNYQALKNIEGESEGILTIGVDVTDLVKARRSVEESEKRLRSIVENSPFPIAVYVGKEMKIQLANQSILNIWGKGNNVIGKIYKKVLPELDNQKVFEQLEQVYTTGIPFHARNQRIDLVVDNRLQTFYFNYSFTPLFNLDGEVYGVMNTGADVTELVNAIQKTEKSEEQLRIAIDGGELGTFDYYPLEKKLLWSARTKELFGLPADADVTFDLYMSALHPEDAHNSQAISQDNYSLKNGLYELEYRSIGIEDGKVRWLKSKGKATYDDAGNPVRFTGVVQEITKLKEAEAEREKAENELRESEGRLRTFADSMPQIVWAADREGNLTYINKSFYTYSGLSSTSKNLRDEWLEIIHPDDREETMNNWEESFGKKTEFTIEHRFKSYNGEYRWQLTRAVPLKDEEGNVETWVATSTDIQQIKELDQQKDHFISIASHELKTPITSIKGYVQLLQSIYEETDDEFLKKSLSAVDKQIVKLTKLISELLDLSKLKMGSLNLVRESFYMNELIEEVVHEMRLLKQDYSIQTVLNHEAKVFADRERITQVLVNLLTNAIKYSPKNKMIEVRSFVEDNFITVVVKDQGIGISKQSQERIFERFFRVEGTNEKTYPGFGIGLFISSEIIQRHEGKIGVNSVPGEGSEFFFSLPLD